MSTASPEPQQLDLVLDWFPNPDHAAIYEAIDKGYFGEVGLDIQPSAVRSLGAAQTGRRRASRPGDLLRARGVPGARAGAARVAAGALVQAR